MCMRVLCVPWVLSTHTWTCIYTSNEEDINGTFASSFNTWQINSLFQFLYNAHEDNQCGYSLPPKLSAFLLGIVHIVLVGFFFCTFSISKGQSLETQIAFDGNTGSLQELWKCIYFGDEEDGKSISNRLAKFVLQILLFANSQNNIERKKRSHLQQFGKIRFQKPQKIR